MQNYFLFIIFILSTTVKANAVTDVNNCLAGNGPICISLSSGCEGESKEEFCMACDAVKVLHSEKEIQFCTINKGYKIVEKIFGRNFNDCKNICHCNFRTFGCQFEIPEKQESEVYINREKHFEKNQRIIPVKKTAILNNEKRVIYNGNEKSEEEITTESGPKANAVERDSDNTVIGNKTISQLQNESHNTLDPQEIDAQNETKIFQAKIDTLNSMLIKAIDEEQNSSEVFNIKMEISLIENEAFFAKEIALTSRLPNEHKTIKMKQLLIQKKKCEENIKAKFKKLIEEN